MFAFRLARDLGKTIEELQHISSEEYTYWMAFYDHEHKQQLKAQKKARKK